MKIIEVNNLTKKYGQLTAVNSINFQVNKGKIYGFVGLNGAGKTTTIRMLLNMINPNEGTVKLFGDNVDNNFDKWNDVGYLVEQASSYPNLTVTENLKVFFNLRNLNDEKKIEEVIQNFKLNEYRDVKAKNLSLGNVQRLSLAKVMMHSPKLLILDEPLNGLDPIGRIEIREHLKELSEQGITIFISSHILDELARFATKIGIIHRGQLITELESKNIKEKLVRKIILDTVDNESAYNLLKDKNYEIDINNDQKIEVYDDFLMNNTEELSKILLDDKLYPRELYIYKEDLEEFFTRKIKEVEK